ncbi:probable cytochrome P450 6t1 [Ceratitis capitata]|uniref:(Mediterranean fruit fly) hypothetical protein n=1 Tax=Ceratitis capitata TaxID=7213 RepID=W8BY95_CERCA|nr:probable cytochrome P450 6t1 [Ceratitis capitata]CAD6996738.1 unnamed protein product [Ceratitis capitata]
MLSVLLAVVLVLLGAAYLWLRRHFRYWQDRDVPHVPPTLLVGNIFDLLRYRCCFGEQFERLYNHAASRSEDFVGIHVLHNHALLLREPALIQRVLVSDFSAFASRFERTDPVRDGMGSLNLFFAQYEVWKEIHQIFSPLFAHGKVKQMYPLLEEVGCKLEAHMAALKYAEDDSVIIEVKELCALHTTDIIASIAFGIEANSLANPQAEFRRMCKEVNEPRFKRVFHLFTMFFFPQRAELIRTHLYSAEYEKFMRASTEYAIAERLRSGAQRNDLIDIFISLKQQTASGARAEVLRQPDFFVAQAAFLLLKGGGALNYEAICNELPYMRMVVDEVLRLYPPTSFLDRRCTAAQGYSLAQTNGVDFRVPQGMPVYISVLGLHRDARFWPQPLVFDPERFSPENRKLHTPMSYLPFGAGPRGCIGTLLGLLEVKTGLIHILKNYRVEPCALTLPEMKFDAKAFVLTADGGTYLRFVKDKLC